MAWLKISELTELTNPDWSEELVFAKNNQNWKIKLSTIASSSWWKTVDLLIVGWWGAWGSASVAGYSGWWWGGWEVIQCYWYPLDTDSYCVKVWNGWTWTQRGVWGTWASSSFWNIIAYWWGGGGLWSNSSSANSAWRPWWNWWGAGSSSNDWTCAYWWYSYSFGNPWGRSLGCWGGWWWGAWWPWWDTPYGSYSWGWFWWPWIRSEIPCKNFTQWCLYWTWGSWGVCCSFAYPWWWAYAQAPTFYGWWWGAHSCAAAWCAWCKWVVYVRYKIWWEINSSTWGYSCYECNGYCIHEFLGNWTFSIS